ncbi:MAG TPA: LLM class flavin-dependent oxidoreductase [Dehalococcoidia bacterium]|nr:LLM class flavin-dependent oxidoreductase [Dehalococcoidia bacterium]
MSIRVGVQFGGWPLGPVTGRRFFEFVDRLEALDFDSLWFSDRVISSSPTLGSFSALGAVAARTQKLKFGNSVLVLPTRHPVEVAKEIATIDMLSGGRMLPAFGLGTDDEREYEAAGISKSERAGRTDEAVGLLRRLWTEEHVSHQGRYYHLTDVTIAPRPVQACPPIWFGGRSLPAYRRAGRLGDGWMASNITPDEVHSGIAAIKAAALEAGRALEPDHFGVIVSFRMAANRAVARDTLVPGLLRPRSDAVLEDYCALGTPDDCIAMVRRYIDAGASKFVMRPLCGPDEIDAQLETLAHEVIPDVEATRV